MNIIDQNEISETEMDLVIGGTILEQDKLSIDENIGYLPKKLIKTSLHKRSTLESIMKLKEALENKK